MDGCGSRNAALRACALLVLLVALALPSSAAAASPSLYTGPGPRPGPDILYQPLADAPQLQNSGIWRAPPIRISGASSYREGEFVYQDFLYDDHGANGGARDPNDPRANAGTSSDTFSSPNGKYTYPTSPAYAMNAADLVEMRIKPLPDATAFRLTLNTLKDPSLTAATIALGGTPGVDVPYPFGANVAGPARIFLTWHGDTATLTDAAGAALPVAPSVTVDTARRQVELRVPHTAWNPAGVERVAAGVGLWDAAAGRYLQVQPAADATHPGGAGALPAPAAFFNVAFRWQLGDPATDSAVEPMPLASDPENGTTEPAWWRDRAQGDALRSGSMAAFTTPVDFGKLAAGSDDDMAGQPHGVPVSGPMDRILASHFETEQGIDYSSLCANPDKCDGEYRGRLQPYSIYIPPRAQPAQGWGMTLLMHSLSANYNQYLSSRNQSQIGDRGPGSIVITGEGRGPDGWYYDAAGADTFEVWADVAARYKLDPAYTSVSGYSMGGYGTYKFATQYPDLFARGQPVVGPPALGIWVPPAAPQPGGEKSNTFHMLPSLRNIPFLIWNASSDELVPVPGAEQQARGFDALGYRYIFDLFAPAEHLTLAINDQFAPAATFLGSAKVDRDPAHVTYVVNPTMDFPAVGTVADHAYWLSKLRLRDGGGAAPRGEIDVRSHGFGVGDPQPNPTQAGGGVLTGGTLPAIAYQEQSRDWGPVPQEAERDRLDIVAKNVSTVTVNARRARVTCKVDLHVTSDGPLTVVLAGCGRSVKVAAARIRLTVHPARVQAGTRHLFRFRATVRRGGRARPVKRAIARFAGHRTRTNANGVARIHARLASAGRYRAAASKSGFARGTAYVRAVRAARFTG